MSNEPRYGKLKRLAQTRQVEVQELIETALKDHGSVAGAARHLNVSHSAIWHWMKTNGYRVTIRQQAFLEKVS